MQKEGWIIIGAAFLLFVCVLSALALAAVGGDAVEKALADDQTSASSTQRSTNVCVGLFNLGACTSQQSSTTTTTKKDVASDSPIGVLVMITAITMAMVAAVFTVFNANDAMV